MFYYRSMRKNTSGSTSAPLRRSAIGLLLTVAALMQSCAIPIPQNALPVESKIAAALGTNEFVLDSNIRYTDGCRLLSLVGCHSDFWNICIRFNNVAAFKKATRNDYTGPDSDLEFARNSGASVTFRDGEWTRFVRDDVNCPSVR